MNATRLLLIHPIGVGLSSRFWDRFISCWQASDNTTALLAPDLSGCGGGEHPNQQLAPEDWAAALIDLLREHNNAPAVLVSQGASLPIALAVLETAPELVAGLVAISPPSWRILEEPFPKPQSQLLWRLLFQGPIGSWFYRYARRRAFLESFSVNNLFANQEDVDAEWLDTLEQEAANMTTRWATFSFLAGFGDATGPSNGKRSSNQCGCCLGSRQPESAVPSIGMMHKNASTLMGSSCRTL